jgi:hypothetical protein
MSRWCGADRRERHMNDDGLAELLRDEAEQAE